MKTKEKRKVLIVQSVDQWRLIFRDIINLELPQLAGDVIYASSFEEAVNLIPTDCNLVVISSAVFIDKSFGSRNIVGQGSDQSQKTGEMLAEIVKRMNPNSKFYIFSQYEPEKSDYIDGYIKKHQFGEIYSSDVERVLKFVL